MPAGKHVRPITKPANMASARPHADRRLYLAGLVFIAITVAAAWVAIWELRRDRIDDEMKDTRNLPVVLAAQTARPFPPPPFSFLQVPRIVPPHHPAHPHPSPNLSPPTTS